MLRIPTTNCVKNVIYAEINDNRENQDNLFKPHAQFKSNLSQKNRPAISWFHPKTLKINGIYIYMYMKNINLICMFFVIP